MATAQPTILQIIPELDTGGAELSAVEIAGAVVQAGGRALVLSEGGRLASKLAEAGGELVFFPAASKNPAQMAWNAVRIAGIIRSEGVDLVHARSRAPAWSAFAAARRTDVPFVTTYHGAYGEKGPLKKLYNSVMARADVVIANSRYTSRLVINRYGTDENKIRVIYRGVDGNAFDPNAIAHDTIATMRKRWGVTGEQRVILNAARLTGWKGQGVIIEAARLLRERGKLSNAVFILAGDAQGRDDYQARLVRQIEESDLTAAVKLVGHVSDMPAALASAHMAVVASTEPEAFGRAATEAQVMSCPVVATNIGAPPETVLSEPAVARDTATGWLIPPNDSVSLADAISKGLSLDENRRRQIGARARAHVLSAFTLDSMKHQTLGVYDDLLGSQLCSSYRHKSGS